ncbi:hypothetical protein CKO_05099 [Citrobacter koseri ATCC BAA-895]|uniref:Uncharacterized protein n=1 Tax=Citrobacter koseri (strain ATCC BAA-895 / CDC 4225-83 / SGSC4696) TaxID=290338 RepID=A8ARM9_CITK8|nr:hypothetical protein CKO_05099 [Citrobacter koseri ATCC BAA-895]
MPGGVALTGPVRPDKASPPSGYAVTAIAQQPTASGRRNRPLGGI